MGCPNHPEAATVAHPSQPGQFRCAKCSQLVAGPAGSGQKYTTGEGGEHKGGCFSVLVLFFALALVVMIGERWML